MAESDPHVQPTDDIYKAVGKKLLDGRAELNDSNEDQERYRAAIRALLDRMYEISDDPSGSDPRYYFAEEDVATLMSFADIMDHPDIGWPEAGMLGMRTVRSGHMWHNRLHTAKSRYFELARTRKAGGERPGYQFGQLGTLPTQQIAFGKDRLLYSKRGHELSKSKGSGWGVLPEPQFILPALREGHGMIDLYGAGSGAGNLASSLMLTFDEELAQKIRDLIGQQPQA